MDQYFCPKCHALLKLQVNGEGQLNDECPLCKYQSPVIVNSRILYREQENVNNRSLKRPTPININSCHDHTLLHTKDKKCPTCSTNDILLYQSNNYYQLGYICCKCRQYWT